MSRNLLYALILIGLVVVVLILTKGSTSVNLVVTEVKASTSMVLLGSTAVGVIIGTLLK